MARRGRPPTLRNTAIDDEAHQFATKLIQAMRAKRMSQSDLAREMFGEIMDPRGYPVAKGRDRISNYMRGKSFPTKDTAEKLATVLGTTYEALMPDAPPVNGSREHFSLVPVVGQPDVCHIEISENLPTSIALQIGILREQGRQQLKTPPTGNAPGKKAR